MKAICRANLAMLLLAALRCSPAAATTPPQAVQAGKAVTEMTATGTFVVKLTPNSAPDAPVSAMAISKTFHGGLDGTSVGQMLAVCTAVDGSAGDVAMERVTAMLESRPGSFALQHSGTMDKGVQSLSVSVVPDSATGDLAGLTGTMAITIDSGEHRYSFRYALPH